MKKQITNSSKAFTLIELLVVIAIVGILAAAVLVAINPGQRIATSRNARVKSDLAEMGNTANIFNADTGTGNCVTGTYPYAWGQALTCGSNTYTYKAQPIDPSGGNYTYNAVRSDGTTACTNTNNTLAGACTAISISGPAYSDGVVDASTNKFWCWKSVTGTITPVAAASNCTP